MRAGTPTGTSSIRRAHRCASPDDGEHGLRTDRATHRRTGADLGHRRLHRPDARDHLEPGARIEGRTPGDLHTVLRARVRHPRIRDEVRAAVAAGPVTA